MCKLTITRLHSVVYYYYNYCYFQCWIKKSMIVQKVCLLCKLWKSQVLNSIVDTSLLIQHIKESFPKKSMKQTFDESLFYVRKLTIYNNVVLLLKTFVYRSYVAFIINIHHMGSTFGKARLEFFCHWNVKFKLLSSVIQALFLFTSQNIQFFLQMKICYS